MPFEVVGLAGPGGGDAIVDMESLLPLEQSRVALAGGEDPVGAKSGRRHPFYLALTDELAESTPGSVQSRTHGADRCSDLAVFEAFFDRPRDWADLDEMNAAGTLDGDRVLGVLVRYVGGSDERIERLRALLGPS